MAQTRKDPPEVAAENGHFPYKRDAALEALATPPDPDTNNHPESWYTSEAIIECTARYIEAQEVWYRDQTGENFDLMQDAAQNLVEARRAHGQNRGNLAVLAGRPGDVLARMYSVEGMSVSQIAARMNMQPEHVRQMIRDRAQRMLDDTQEG